MARLWGCTFVIGALKNDIFCTSSMIGTNGEIGAPPNVCNGKPYWFGISDGLEWAFIPLIVGDGVSTTLNDRLLFVSIFADFIHYITVCKDFLNVLLVVVDFIAYSGIRQCAVVSQG